MSKVVKVSMETVESNDVFHYVAARCNFCQKESGMNEATYKNIVKLGHGHYYCSFCLRNRFNHKKKGHILLLDFRGIIGFYLNYLYEEGGIWYSQILDYVRKHAIIGLQNPVFAYDHESMLWFIDFSRVGEGSHKVPLEAVHHTIRNILDGFELPKNVKNCSVEKMVDKYKEAVDEYYKTRKRPEGRRVLSPTLKNCAYRAQCDWDETKHFTLTNKDTSMFPSGSNFKEMSTYTEDLETQTEEFYTVRVRKKKSKGEVVGWEGVVTMPGSTNSKVAKKDGSAVFEKLSSLKTAARKNARKLGLKLRLEGSELERSEVSTDPKSPAQCKTQQTQAHQSEQDRKPAKRVARRQSQ